MSSGFRVNSMRFQSMNGTSAVWSNQFPDPIDITNDPRENEILFLSNSGAPVSTGNFVYIPNVEGVTGRTNLLGINGDLQVNGSSALLGNLGVGEITNGRYVELAADTLNNAYIDFHSRDTFSTDYDARILSNGGGTGNGHGNLFIDAATTNFACPVRLGSWTANPFRLDYGRIENVSEINQSGTQNFVANLFTTSPVITLTLRSTGRLLGAETCLFVLTESCESFTWQIHGTPAVGSIINWIAVGL